TRPRGTGSRATSPRTRRTRSPGSARTPLARTASPTASCAGTDGPAMSTDASAGTDTSALAEALLVLRAHLEQVVLPLDVAGAGEARTARREVLDQLDD